MVPTQDLLEIVDFVENFDQKGIGIALLSTPIRSGSVLFHSLIDHHPQILQIPISFCYFWDWEYVLKASSPETLVDDFFTKSFALAPRVAGLGPGQAELLDLKFPDIAQVMKSVVPFLSALDRKKLLLLFHAAYAKVFSIDLHHIKVIFLHHHILPTIFGYFSYLVVRENFIQEEDLNSILELTPEQYQKTEDQLLSEVFSDFPHVKLLITIRNPWAGLFASEKFMMSLPGKTHDVLMYYLSSFNALSQYYSVYALKQKLGEVVQLIKFEELHAKTEEVMTQVASSLGVEYQASLLETTFGGLLWSGAGTTRNKQAVVGTGPHLLAKENDWKTQWQPENIALFAPLVNPLAATFGYAPFEPTTPEYPMDRFLPIESEAFTQYVPKTCEILQQSLAPYQADLTTPSPHQEILRANIAQRIQRLNQQLEFWNAYPVIRKKTLQYLIQCAKQVG